MSQALPLGDFSGAVSAYDQNSSDFLYHIFGETRDGKTCMSPVVRSLIQRLATET